MSSFLLHKYISKIINGRLVKHYRYRLNLNDSIFFSYFYWLYQKDYKFNSEGICFRLNYGLNGMASFVIYNNIKNIKFNQLYFLNNPFIFFIKKRVILKKKQKNLFIL